MECSDATSPVRPLQLAASDRPNAVPLESSDAGAVDCDHMLVALCLVLTSSSAVETGGAQSKWKRTDDGITVPVANWLSGLEELECHDEELATAVASAASSTPRNSTGRRAPR